jgi:arylsulfatase
VTPAATRSAHGVAAALGVALAVWSCRVEPKAVVYDLARRVSVAERWSARETVLFGTPAAEPQQAEGFYREAAGGTAEPFLWSKEEAEVAFTWPSVASRAAVVDLAPYRGIRDQSAEVRLNGKAVTTLSLNDQRSRYAIPLPADAQRPGDNRVRFVFRATASPADEDPRNLDRRRLAAAFYSLVVGDAADAGLQDLLTRDAPHPFSVTEAGGLPILTLLAPSAVRFAVKLPAGAELRFTPDLHPGARAAASSASFRVTLESAGQPPRELWSRVIGPRDPKSTEAVVRLPGAAGDIVRLSLEVGAGPGARFAWGTLATPRIVGSSGSEALEPAAYSAEENARGDALRRATEGRNVIFVILDAARAQQFGAYGYSRPTTPEIDRIASEGIVFEKAFTPAVYTLAAMSSVWTSQYPDRHHSEVSFSSRLPKDRLTLAELLSAQGIETGGFVANAVAGTAGGFERGFATFDEVWKTLGSGAGGFRKVVPDWLAAHGSRRFFLYVHFREPHFPYDPEPPFDARFGPVATIAKSSRRDMAWITDANQGRRPLSAGERDDLVRLYDGNLAFADQEVGALRRELESRQLWDKTVVIVAADHGEELFEHGWIGHNVHLHEESVHVPLIVRLPGGPKGKRDSSLVDLLDVAPTIADVFGVLGKGGSDKAFQGRSLLPVAGGASGKAAVLSRTVWDRPRYALRDARYKYLYDTRSGEEKLYDVSSDPGEDKDLLATDPLRAAYYRQTLHRWTLGLAARPPAETAEAVKLTPAQCESLRALGYLNADCR